MLKVEEDGLLAEVVFEGSAPPASRSERRLIT
jgi:hypothetical protein